MKWYLIIFMFLSSTGSNTKINVQDVESFEQCVEVAMVINLNKNISDVAVCGVRPGLDKPEPTPSHEEVPETTT